MSKRAWLAFGAVQIIGGTLTIYGAMYSESVFVCGFLLLLPGNLPAMVLNQKLLHLQAAYIFFPVAVACNATLWVTCAAVWRNASASQAEHV